MLRRWCMCLLALMLWCGTSLNVDELKQLNLSRSSIVAHPGSLRYAYYLVPANAACVSAGCADVIVLPANVEDVSKVVAYANRNGIDLKVKGAGHGYTCQSSTFGGILIDTRLLREISINEHQGAVKVGAGLRFSDILPALKRQARPQAIIHGQCLGVGVAGFTLHGGVHFGALSELHGLGLHNIVGAQAVLANGTIVEIEQERCRKTATTAADVGEMAMMSPSQCDDLRFALSGAGSSFALVTSLTLRTHPVEKIRSAIGVLSVDLRNVTRAREDLLRYMHEAVPEASVSLTLFGLDARFKADVFQLVFSRERGQVMVRAVREALQSIWLEPDKTSVHFVCEASWKEDGGVEEGMTLEKLRDLQTRVNVGTYQSLTIRPWVAAATYSWAVPSYDLVWGRGHRYAGASLTVPPSLVNSCLDSFFASFVAHLKTPQCSDCVAVMHRVGPGLRRASAASGANNSSSFHRGLDDAALWFELDCGLFRDPLPFRRGSWQEARWEKCSSFVDAAQVALEDSSTAKEGAYDSSSFHYPNVPNLSSGRGKGAKGWQHSYYGSTNYHRLQRIKAELDPADVFSHVQSIKSSSSQEVENSPPPIPCRRDGGDCEKRNRACRRSFALAAYSDLLALVGLVATRIAWVSCRSLAPLRSFFGVLFKKILDRVTHMK